MLLAVTHAKAAEKWVTAYYTNWQTNAYPTNRIDYTAVTHIVLAHWLTNTNGTIQSSGWDSTCSSIVGPAHAAGVKVLMMLGGSDDTNFASAASPTYQPTLISSIQGKVSACGLDGVDLDWEDNVNTANFISLAKNLRAASPGYVITAPVDASVQPASLAASLSAYCDQVNMMTYGNANLGNGWVSWYFSALAGDGSTHPDSVAKYVDGWENAGTPAGKIGVGIGFYMNGWTAPVTGALQSTAGSSVPVQELPYGWSLANGGGLLSCYYNQPGGTYQFDPSPDLSTEPGTPPEQPSISIPSGVTSPSPCPSDAVTWVTYEDEASVAAKARYIVNNNLGGAIIWTIQEGAVDPATGRNPLLDALKLNLNGAGPAPMPQVGSSGAVSVAGPTTITVTGLPTNLGLVDIKWWNYTSSVAWDSKSDTGFQTYGQPSAYTIQGSSNGTTWTTLSCSPSCNVSGEHYTGRQFVADLTGTGYTQIRMNISGIVGTNAGYDVLTVNGQAGTNDSNDTYLLFGDSITANCWGAATNTGPTEQLGTQIHAAHPASFPVSTVGGQSGWLTSTALDTSTYGIPNIQKFLQDMPAVKYVGISLGTNDANGNVSAADYCANMQSIVQYIIAAGKTPIIPTIVASPSAAVQSNAPAMNACLATLEQNYPSIIVGPDLWTLFKGHSTSDGWFLDSLHPSLGTGCTALQNAWAKALVSKVYPNGSSNPPTTPPSVPTGLAATAPTSTQVNLTWNPSTDANYPSSSLTYTLYRNGSAVTTTAAGVTSHSDTGLVANTTYTYTVSASDPAGNTSAQSASVSITTPASPAPSVPAGLAASAPTSTQVNLTWNPSTDANYPASSLTYSVYRNGALVTKTASGVAAYSDTGRAASTTYTYTVSACDPAGNTSAQSASVSVATPGNPAPSTPPSVPTGLAASAPTITQANLTWNPSTDVNYASSSLTYTLYRNGSRVTTTNAGVTSYSDSGLAASTTYAYTVSASDPAGNTSAQSAAVNATTPPASSGKTPQRVRGCSAEAGSAKAACKLTGVTPGDVIIIGATSLEAGTSPLTFSDNCGGKYTVLDTSNNSSNAVAQGFATGSSGTCVVTAQTSGGWATTLVVEEITSSTPNVHGWSQNFSASAGKSYLVSVTTPSNDYVFSWAVDAAGGGGSHMIVSSPSAVHDFNNVFPIVDADTAQSTAGTATATWKFNVSTSHATIGVVGFH
jgi:GH18 family chitinase/lysophospholipase L1-like esterase/chitodextrinase